MQIEFGLLDHLHFVFYTIKENMGHKDRFTHIELGFVFIQIKSWNKGRKK